MQQRMRGRVVVVALLMAMTTAGLVMAVRWQLARFKTRETPAQDDRSITIPDGRVRLAQVGAARAAESPHEAVAENQEDQEDQEDQKDQLKGAEDGHLGKAISQPRTLGVAPPAPTRASVDPEPPVPEDPRDFELPAQDHSAGRP